MLNPRIEDRCYISPAERPRLIVVIDTEEDFDWSQQKSRYNTSVQSLRWISRVAEILDEYRIMPLFVIDYPVVSQPEGYLPLLEIYKSGRCLIGAHLHPWVNPPFEEPIDNYNSFPGNLGYALESAKLKVLTESITEKFGARPVIYKAGRYGVGSYTAKILEEQGYEIDMSVCPQMDYSSDGGPNFCHMSAWPFWFGGRSRILELPLTIDFTGGLRKWGSILHRGGRHPVLSLFHPIGLMSRLRLLDKIWLSPEGYASSEHIRLVRTLYGDGLRIFSFAFHSPSVHPGNTPYVRSEADLQVFLSRCRTFFDFFMRDLGGQPTTPIQLRKDLLRSACRGSN
jgi:hypothetical protein